VSQFDNLHKAFSKQRNKKDTKVEAESFEPEIDELFALDEDQVCFQWSFASRSWCKSRRWSMHTNGRASCDLISPELTSSAG